MRYRLIRIRYDAVVNVTTFDGWDAENIADKKFTELSADSKTKYVVLMCESENGDWSVRTEQHYKEGC